MAMTIFDLVTAENITVYYDDYAADRPPFLGEELFPGVKQLGLQISHIKAARGLPVVLKPSAFDVKAVPRLRKGFEKTTMEMPYFKESMYIDEVTRQELNTVLATGNQAMIDLVLNKIFNDPATLIDAARARREMMRMMLITTGTISITANGQDYDYDYNVPDHNKITVTVPWSDPDADIIGDITAGLDLIDEETGVRPTRGLVNQKTWQNIKKNKALSLLVHPIGAFASTSFTLTDVQISALLLEHTGTEIIINNKNFIDDDGKQVKYVPDDTAAFFPAGTLGNTFFGTTPQESDLMTGSAANVSITDIGVSVTTAKQIDPVNVETIVAMIVLPSFPMAEYLLLLDTAG